MIAEASIARADAGIDLGIPLPDDNLANAFHPHRSHATGRGFETVFGFLRRGRQPLALDPRRHPDDGFVRVGTRFRTRLAPGLTRPPEVLRRTLAPRRRDGCRDIHRQDELGQHDAALSTEPRACPGGQQESIAGWRASSGDPIGVPGQHRATEGLVIDTRSRPITEHARDRVADVPGHTLDVRGQIALTVDGSEQIARRGAVRG